MAEKFRVGIIASGRIARMHGGGWRGCDRTEIVAIADSHPEVLATYASEFDVNNQYLDYREMMENREARTGPRHECFLIPQSGGEVSAAKIL